MNKIPCSCIAVLIVIASSPVAAGDHPKFEAEATASFWWNIIEEVENGLIQAGSLDQAADVASGFSFRHGRVTLDIESPHGKVGALIRIRLEERTDIIDFWGAYHGAPWLNIYIGQMKVPSTFEVLTSYQKLDFATRTTFGQNVGDYSLSRTPYISSIMAVKSYHRDLGLAWKGVFSNRERTLLSYFLMISNGIGANRYIGGRESGEYIFTNRFGDFYYGLRLEAMPVDWVTIGAHFSMNTHDDIALGERGPVFDIDRSVWTVDLRAQLAWGLRVAGFFGDGDMNDFFDAQRYRFDYRGWGLWTLKAFLKDRIELGLRYDSFTTEFNEDGNETTQRNWTFGVNFRLQENLRLQLNYTDKETLNDFEPDVDDNILFMNFQLFFHAVPVQ